MVSSTLLPTLSFPDSLASTKPMKSSTKPMKSILIKSGAAKTGAAKVGAAANSASGSYKSIIISSIVKTSDITSDSAGVTCESPKRADISLEENPYDEASHSKVIVVPKDSVQEDD